MLDVRTVRILFLAAGTVAGQLSSATLARAQALTLDRAVEIAVDSAPEIQAGRAAIAAAQAAAISAGQLPDPQLLIGVDNLPVSGPDAYSTTRDFMTMRKVGVMQEFPAARKRRLQHAQALAQADVADAELVEAQLDIARDTAQAWIRQATAQASLDDLQRFKPEVELQAAAARSSVASGLSPVADALAAEAAVAKLDNRLLAMQIEVRRAAFDLERRIGAAAGQPLAPIPSFSALPATAAALQVSVHEHGALLTYESRIAKARTEIDLARAARRPDWSAELAFGKRSPEYSDMLSMQLRVRLPLFTRYRQDPIISSKHAELRRLQAEREAQVRMHTAELQQALIEWELLGAQLKHYEAELLPLARERSRAALAAYRAGRGDLRAALDAHAQEVELVIERADLLNDRGRTWAYLRYLGPEHLKR